MSAPRPNCSSWLAVWVSREETCAASSWFDTGTDATAPPATPSAIPRIVTISSSIANYAATLTFFTPMAVSTPTSYLRSRMLNRLSTTAPTVSTTMSSVRANLARLSSGTRLDS